MDDMKLVSRSRDAQKQADELIARFEGGERGPELLAECQAVADQLLVTETAMRARMMGFDLPKELEL